MAQKTGIEERLFQKILRAKKDVDIVGTVMALLMQSCTMTSGLYQCIVLVWMSALDVWNPHVRCAIPVLAKGCHYLPSPINNTRNCQHQLCCGLRTSLLLVRCTYDLFYERNVAKRKTQEVKGGSSHYGSVGPLCLLSIFSSQIYTVT